MGKSSKFYVTLALVLKGIIIIKLGVVPLHITHRKRYNNTNLNYNNIEVWYILKHSSPHKIINKMIITLQLYWRVISFQIFKTLQHSSPWKMLSTQDDYR